MLLEEEFGGRSSQHHPAAVGSRHNGRLPAGCFTSRNSGQFFEEEIGVFVNGTKFSPALCPMNWSPPG